MTTVMQKSFVSGEISPSIYGRTDKPQYTNGAATMRNFFVSYHGGAVSRSGLRYAGTSLQSGSVINPPRLIPFQFSIDQGFALEFGQGTINHIITGTSAGAVNPLGGHYVRLTVDTQRMFDGGEVTVSGVLGTVEANGTWDISIIDDTHLDLLGTTFVNAYVSGGFASTAGYIRIIQNGAYLVEIAKSVVSATQANPAVIGITAHGYSPGDWLFFQVMGGMTNFNNLTWIVNSVPNANTLTLTDLYGNVIDSTTFSAYTSGGTASRIYNIAAPYAAVDLPFIKYTQSAETMTLCCINQSTSTEYPSYELQRTAPTSQFPGGVWTLTQDTFSSSIDAPSGVTVVAQPSTTLTTYYGYVVTAVNSVDGSESNPTIPIQVQNNDINIFAGSNVINWAPVAGASSYNVYASSSSYNTPVPVGSLYGFIGSVQGTSFTDNNILRDFTKVPPQHNNPFARSAIVDVAPVLAGIGYTQDNIGYTVNTFTGSGFVGIPVVVNNLFSNFVILNGGEGYADTDTITITGGGSATGSISFQYWANLAQNDTITLNGQTWTFVQPPNNAAHQTLCMSSQTGLTLGECLTTFVSNLNQSNIAAITVALYSLVSTTTGYRVDITYKTGGTAGNVFSLATSLATGGATVSAATLTGGTNAGGGATAALTLGAATGAYPGVPAYFQQRRVYAYSLNLPDTYWMSQPGSFNNMDSSVPVTDSDAISGSPWAQQINGIQALVPMPGGLVVFTGKQAWQVNGGNSLAITPSNQNATPQAANGCHFHVPPIAIGPDILYLQSKGSIVRGIEYSFYLNIYSGTDLTLFSNHLFENHQLEEWAWSEEPFKIVWVVRDDGKLLSFTYMKEQEIAAWARHDTNGLFQSVCSVTEPPSGPALSYVDAVYTIVRRYINGGWRYYVERFDDRSWSSVEDCFCVDAGLSNTLNYPDAVLSPAAPFGTDNISSTNVIDGGSGYVSPMATATDSTGAGSGATFSVTVSGGAITAVTPLTEGTDYVAGATTITITDSAGSGAVVQPIITNIVAFNTSSAVFINSAGNGAAGDVIRVDGGKATVTSFVSATQVLANITQDLTTIVSDDPNNDPIPVPAPSGQWTIATPITVVSGLNHLEGMTVTGLADGGVITATTVADGSITLDVAASAINVGLGYICQLQSLALEIPAENTNQGKRKNMQAITARLESTRGLQLGANQPIAAASPNGAEVPWANMIEIKDRNFAVNAGAAVPLGTGDTLPILIKGNWNSQCRIAAQQIYPLPATVNSLIPRLSIGDNEGK